jgi:hypothetical protein
MINVKYIFMLLFIFSSLRAQMQPESLRLMINTDFPDEVINFIQDIQSKISQDIPEVQTKAVMLEPDQIYLTLRLLGGTVSAQNVPATQAILRKGPFIAANARFGKLYFVKGKLKDYIVLGIPSGRQLDGIVQNLNNALLGLYGAAPFKFVPVLVLFYANKNSLNESWVISKLQDINQTFILPKNLAFIISKFYLAQSVGDSFNNIESYRVQ